MSNNQSKHTPGPWVVGTRDHAEYRITGPKGSLPEVAIIPSGRDERQANAALIGPAPELLAALERILRAHDSGNNGAYMGEAVLCRMFAEQARAAIAKAKGES